MKNPFEKYELEIKRKNIILLLCLIVIIILSSVIMTLILQKKEVKFVSFSPEGKYKIRIIDDRQISTSTKQLIIESQLKEYVKERFSSLGGRKYNGDEVSASKVLFIKAFSTGKIYQSFSDEYKTIFEESKFWKREVEIVDFIKQEPKKYFVKARFIDYYENKSNPTTHDYNFFLKYDLVQDIQLKPEEVRVNPLGIKINWFRYGNKIL